MQLPYHTISKTLLLLVDSKEKKFLGDGEWKRKKHGAKYLRQWWKVHLVIDAQTLEIQTMYVTNNCAGDALMFSDLPGQITPDEAVASVSKDSACVTNARHGSIAQRGLQAVISPCKNAQPWKAPLVVGAHVRNEAWRACCRLARGIWKRWSGYHRPSLVETKIYLFKRLGERVIAHTFECQVVHCSTGSLILTPNQDTCVCHGKAASGWGASRPHTRLV